MTLKWPLMTLKWPLDQKPMHHCVRQGKTNNSCRPFYPLTLIILYILMKKPVKNIKNDQNDLEMTFKRPSNDLEIKKITLLCCPWNNLQKLSWFLSSNSYNIFFIDERPVFGSMNSHTPFKHDDNVQKKSHHHFFGW